MQDIYSNIQGHESQALVDLDISYKSTGTFQ